MKTETPYRERLRLRKEIKARNDRLIEITKEADAELIRVGLRRMAKRGVIFDVKEMNHICFSGHFRTREWSAKEFDMEGHHNIIVGEPEPGVTVSVSLDDTHLSMQVTWKIPDHTGALSDARNDVGKYYAKASKFLKKYGIVVDCAPAIYKLGEKMGDFRNLAALVHTFHQTENTADMVKLVDQLSTHVGLAVKNCHHAAK
jgi:hypothetical protein